MLTAPATAPASRQGGPRWRSDHCPRSRGPTARSTSGHHSGRTPKHVPAHGHAPVTWMGLARRTAWRLTADTIPVVGVRPDGREVCKRVGSANDVEERTGWDSERGRPDGRRVADRDGAAMGAHAALLDRLGPVLPAGYDELNFRRRRRSTCLASPTWQTPVATCPRHSCSSPRHPPTSGGSACTCAVTPSHCRPVAVARQSRPACPRRREFRFVLGDDSVVHLHDLGVRLPDGVDFDDDAKVRLRAAFEQQYRGTVEATASTGWC